MVHLQTFYRIFHFQINLGQITKNLTSQIKSVLKHDRGISEQDLKYAKKAYYTVYFKMVVKESYS